MLHKIVSKRSTAKTYTTMPKVQRCPPPHMIYKLSNKTTKQHDRNMFIEYYTEQLGLRSNGILKTMFPPARRARFSKSANSKKIRKVSANGTKRDQGPKLPSKINRSRCANRFEKRCSETGMGAPIAPPPSRTNSKNADGIMKENMSMK